MAHLLPSPKMQFFDINGDPLSGGKVNTYEAGTSTRKATYTTAAEAVANANPVILDSRGEANIFWSTGSYKIVVTDSDDVEIYTVDAITLSATGEAGASMRSGTGVPSDSLGENGDRYLRADTGQIYLKDAGAYTVESTISLPASVIVNTPAGNLAATDAQAALNELQTELDAATAHISDSSAAHAASAISNSPTGNLAATDAQAALNELQTDVDTRLSALTGDVTASGGGSQAATIANDAVTNAKMANAAAWTIKMRNAGTSGDLSDAALADITEEATPAAADFILGFLASGEIRKFDVANISSGGSGGGTKVDWSEQANAPLKQNLSNIPVYSFGAGLDQSLYAVINVPSTYLAGSPISMKIKAISEDTSGNILLSTTAILVRAEVDEYDSTTNTHVSTNSAITMSSANDREPQKITLDLCEADGEVNAVAISAGDMLLVRFFRGSDTATGDVHFIVGSEEVTFS